MKERIPLAFLESLTLARNENLQYVQPSDEQGTIFVLKDKSATSGFYFKIIKQEQRATGLHFRVEYKPRAKGDVNPNSTWLTETPAINAINEWLALIAAYYTTQSIFDDPLTRSYEEKFAAKFDIVDEDAAYAGFDLEQQVYLDEYLNGVKSKVQALKQGRPEAEAKQLDEIEAEAADLQKNLTRESKRSIIRRLARIWAKAQKIGLDVIKEIFVSVAADLTSKLITGRIP